MEVKKFTQGGIPQGIMISNFKSLTRILYPFLPNASVTNP